MADVRARYRDAGVSETLFLGFSMIISESGGRLHRISQDTLESWGDLDSAINVLTGALKSKSTIESLHRRALCRDISIGRVAELRQLLAVSNDYGELQDWRTSTRTWVLPPILR